MKYYKKTSLKNFSNKSIDFLKSFKENLSFLENFQKDDNLGLYSYNLDFCNGHLESNCGLKELTLPEEAQYSDIYEKKLDYSGLISFKKVWRYKYYSQNNSRYEYVLLMYASDKKMYYNNIYSFNDNLYAIGNFTFDEVPTLLFFRLNGADCVGIATSTNNLVVWNCDAYPYAVSTAPKFRSICVHNDRLFAIENGANYVVRYSSSVDPTSLTSVDGANDGRIDLNDFKGELRKIISHFDSLYVFRDFGISKITPYSSNKQFLASNVFSSSMKIYSNTICVCNENICFLCEDGLYKFDGYKVVKIDLPIFNNFKNYLQTECQTCFYNNKLYISCFLKFSSQDSTVQNNSIVIVDLNTFSYSIIYGINACGIFALKDLNTSKLIVCLNDQTNGKKLWELCSASQSEITFNKLWESNKFYVTNLNKEKVLKNIEVINSKAFSLTVKTDKTNKTFSISANSSLKKIKIDLKGKYFSFSFSSANKQFDISYFKANFVEL